MESIDQNIVSLLRQNSIFHGLTEEQIHEILPCIVHKLKAYDHAECVYEKGDEVHDLGIVVEGHLIAISEDAEGNITSRQTIEPNGVFGEVVVFSTNGSLPHKVIAADGTKVLFLSGEFFSQQCSKHCSNKEAHTEIVRNLLRLLSDNAIMLSKKIAYLTAPDLKTKIAMYLCELYEVNRVTTFNMPLNRDRLADFFSVARPSLSRELIHLKNQNIIDFYRSSVKILDLAALRRISRGE